MNAPTKTLPDGYVESGRIDLKRDKRLALILNLVAFFVALLGFYLLSALAAVVRPGVRTLTQEMTAGRLVLLLGLALLHLTVHELIHGLFFWVFTRDRPVFALRPLYAYAGAPEWYLPARQFALVAAAPLVVIDLVGLAVMLLGPVSWAILFALVVALNTGGSVGDLYVLFQIWRMNSAWRIDSPALMINDTGDVVTLYGREVDGR